MGGHGGLNILPQKRWNVYNYDNREKVRRDEEAAAKEEQLKREQSRKRDSEFRLNQLRAARGMPNDADPKAEMESASSSSGHINLFEGIRMFDPKDEGEEPKNKKKQKKKDDASDGSRSAAKIMSAEDEKYRLGYGVAGKGVKVPWYLEKKTQTETETKPPLTTTKTKPPTKTVEELREERLRREHREKQRERALIRQTRR